MEKNSVKQIFFPIKKLKWGMGFNQEIPEIESLIGFNIW